MKTLLTLLAALTLTGCAYTSSLFGRPADNTVPQPQPDPLVAFQQFTADDLTAALADANAHQDQAASNCYSTLLQILPQLKPPTAPAVKGVFTLLQIKRDLLASGGAGANALLKTVNLGCAALVNDEIGTAVKVGAIGAGAVLLK
jgi:hypothetical protein